MKIDFNEERKLFRLMCGEMEYALRDCFYPLAVDLHYKVWGDLPINTSVENTEIRFLKGNAEQ